MAPRHAAIPILLEVRQSFIKHCHLLIGGTDPLQKILLLQFTQPREDLPSIFCFEFRQFSEYLGFAHSPDFSSI